MKILDLKIGVRLCAAFGAVLFLTATMTAVGVWELSRIADAKTVMKATAYKQQLAERWLGGIAKNAVRTFAKAKSDDAEDQLYFDDEIKKESKRNSDIQNELGPLIQGDEGKRLFEEVVAQRKLYIAIRDSAFKLKNEGGENKTAIKNFVDTKLMPTMNLYVQSIQKVADYQESLFEKAETTIDEVYAQAIKLLVALGTIALILGAVLAWLLSRSVTGPLGRAVVLAQSIAAGDLTTQIEVSSRDEVGQLLSALKSMNEDLLATVIKVRSGTATIATASQQIAAGNLDLSSRTEEQASSLQETASSMEELTGTVKQNADNARQANVLAESAAAVAIQGGSVVNGVVETMASINESSRKIADIIGVIDGIAFQTNILALNAAVEAARAGEQGRGFAVVASEVRNLAQRSAAAARDIKTLISDSVEKVDAGGRLVNQAGATMSEIVRSITSVTDIMSEIAAASSEQTIGIEQINSAIGQMDQVTQQNAALVEEAAAAADSLQKEAMALANVVSIFKVGDAATPSRESSRHSLSHMQQRRVKSTDHTDFRGTRSQPQQRAIGNSSSSGWEGI